MIINLVGVDKDDVKRGLTAKVGVGLADEDFYNLEKLVPLPNDPIHCFELKNDSAYDLSGVYGFEDNLKNMVLVLENSDIDDYIADIEDIWDEYDAELTDSKVELEDDVFEDDYEDSEDEWEDSEDEWEESEDEWEESEDEWEESEDSVTEEDIIFEDDFFEDEPDETEDSQAESEDVVFEDDFLESDHINLNKRDRSEDPLKSNKEQQKIDFSSLGLNFNTEDIVLPKSNTTKTNVTQIQTNTNSSTEQDTQEKEKVYPTNPIEFLKLYPRTPETEVKKHCNAKEVDRYISRGLIQRFKGRLFI